MSNELVADAGISTPNQTSLSQIERVVDTFIAPSKTFTDILRSSSWWLPFVLMILGSLASGFVIDHQVGFDRVYQNQLAQSPKQEDRVNQLPPDQKAHTIVVGANVTKYITYAFPVLLLIIFGLYSLVVWAAFNFGLGAKTTYSQVFAASFYSALPYLLLTLLTIITLYAGGNAEAFDQKNPVGTNLAYYLPDASPMLKALLGQIDVIKLWTLFLEILGMAIIAKKTFAQSAVVIGSLWVLTTILSVAGAAFS